MTSIPEPPPSNQPYVDADAGREQVAEAFVRAALKYDATIEAADTFLKRVVPMTTPAELERLRKSPRAELDWQVMRGREERVGVIVTGVSVDATGQVVVSVERTTSTSFATVRDFVHVSLELVQQHGTLKVASARGGGL